MANNLMKFLAPPELIPEHYSRWKKEMKLWEAATTVATKKQAPTIFLSLTGKAREAVLEIDPDELTADTGMTSLYKKLDKMFLVDDNLTALNAYAHFEKYVRPPSATIADFQIEFERMVARLKDCKIILPEPVLAYRALKSA